MSKSQGPTLPGLTLLRNPCFTHFFSVRRSTPKCFSATAGFTNLGWFMNRVALPVSGLLSDCIDSDYYVRFCIGSLS